MADEKQFPIKITGDASSLVAASQETNAALQSTKIKLAELTPEQKATTAAMSEGGKAAQDAGKKVEEGGKHAEKSAVSHRDLRAAAHGLREEFPLLGHIASMAIHPIGLAVAAAASAFAIWKMRVDEAVNALGGFEMPDISDRKIGQVTAMAEAWKSFKEAFEGAVKGYNSVEQAADRAIKRMEHEAELQKKILEARKKLELAWLEENKTSMKPADYEKAKLDIEDRFASEGRSDDKKSKEDVVQAERDKSQALLQDAAKKLEEAKGIHVGSKEEDAGITERQEKIKAAAEAEKKDAEERLELLARYRDGLMDAGEKLKFLATYPLRYGEGTPGAQAEDLEKQRVTGADVTIGAANKWLAQSAARDEARKRKFGLTAEAGAEMGQAGVVEAQASEHAAAYAGEADVNRRVAGLESESRMAGAIAKANQEHKQVFEEILKQMGEGHRVSADMLKRLKELEATQRDLMKRANDKTPPI